MSLRGIAVTCVALALIVQTGYAAEEGGEYVRVYEFASGTKPSVSGGKYVWRKVSKAHGSFDPALMCEDCMTKVAITKPVAGTKPSVAAERGEAFVCMHCTNLVWRDQGKEVKFAEAGEHAACKAILTELKKPQTESQAYTWPAADGYHGTKPAVHEKVHK